MKSRSGAHRAPVTLWLVVGATLFAAGTPIARGSDGGLIQGGATPDLFLFYTGDVIGYVDACG